MMDLSITQQYLICAVNEKGILSDFRMERKICFIAAGLLDLKLENCILVDKKDITVLAPLPSGRDYLKPLYDFINQSKSVNIEKVVGAYLYSMTEKQFDELFYSVGSTLEGAGLTEAGRAGLFGNRKSYIPATAAINRIIDMVRAELLEGGEVTEDIAALIILLEKSKSLKNYFSGFEQKEMKNKLQEIVNLPEGKVVSDMIEYVDTMISVMTTMFVLFS